MDGVTVVFHGGLFEGKEALLGDVVFLPTVLWVPRYQAALTMDLRVYDTVQPASVRYELEEFNHYTFAGVTR